MKGIALGTVQFGLPYGVANRHGQPSLTQVADILAVAKAAGINTLDTAISYGSSEERLGAVGIDGWRVVSKLPSIPNGVADIEFWVKEAVYGSLRRLQIDSLYGLLLHHPDDLLEDRGNVLFQVIENLKQCGLVKRIGVSIYDPSQLIRLLSRFKFDLVQAPFNVVDRRLLKNGYLSQLNQEKIEIHTRSTFLQGLLLLNSETRPEKFSRWQGLWDVWESWLQFHDVSALQTCLSFALNQQGIERVLVGVDTVEQLEEILAIPVTTIPTPPSTICTDDIDLINPSRWSNL